MGQAEHHGDGVSQADHQTDAPPGERSAGLGQTFQQEAVVTQVRLGIVGREGKGHQAGEGRPVRLLDGELQGMVALGPLALLHPVKDILARLLGRGVQRTDAARVYRARRRHVSPGGSGDPAFGGPEGATASRARGTACMSLRGRCASSLRLR